EVLAVPRACQARAGAVPRVCRRSNIEHRTAVVGAKSEGKNSHWGNSYFRDGGVNGRDTVPRPCLPRFWLCRGRAKTVPRACRCRAKGVLEWWSDGVMGWDEAVDRYIAPLHRYKVPMAVPNPCQARARGVPVAVP